MLLSPPYSIIASQNECCNRKSRSIRNVIMFLCVKRNLIEKDIWPTFTIALFHDNPLHHTDKKHITLWEYSKWEFLTSHLTGLIISHWLLPVVSFVERVSEYLNDKKYLKNVVIVWLHSKEAEFYVEGFQNLWNSISD